MYKQLFSQLSGTHTIITVNQRLVTYLTQVYEHEQQTHLQTVWPSTNILAFNTWCTVLYQQTLNPNTVESNHAPPSLLLNEQQALHLWQQIIQNTHHDQALLNVAATAQLAQQAWQLCYQWQLLAYLDSDPNSAINQSEDCQTFLNWSHTYRETCAQHAWIDQASLPDYLMAQLEQRKLTLPEAITFVGFDEINPQIVQLIQHIEANGCKVDVFEQTSPAAKTRRVSFANSEDEITAMAHWAKQTWPQNQADTIACVVPNLHQIRPQVEAIFNKVFYPRANLPGHSSAQHLFNLSGGKALANYPLVHCALLLIKLSISYLSYSELGYLLRSPYLARGAIEFTQRAQLDRELRYLGASEYTLKNLLEILNKIKNNNSLKDTLQQIYEIKLKQNIHYQEQQSFVYWCDYFQQLLIVAGWPGDRSLNSSEHQQIARFLTLCEEGGRIDQVQSAMVAQYALHHLRHLAQSTLFQEETTQEPPIQVLGILETAGLRFEHLWIMGLDEQHWPPAPNANPFIPLTSQRRLGMPHASAERECQFSELSLQRLRQSANQVMLSYAQQDGDQAQLASPLIAQFPEIDISQVIDLPTQSLASQLFTNSNTQLEWFDDEQAPAVTKNEHISGGSAIFKQQAACAFRAFAEFRLHAESLPEPELGLAALDRGILVHDLLELVWRELSDQQTLLTKSGDELHSLLEQSAQQAINNLAKRVNKRLPKRFIQLEKQRLINLVTDWLDKEKSRQSFTVTSIESWHESEFAGIEFHMKIDRLDTLADGSNIIIDYKTGKPSPNAWFGDRPDDPQLPLYCVTHEQAINGIAFAQVRADDMRYKGITCVADQLPGTQTVDTLNNGYAAQTWPEQKQLWRTSLMTLSHKFQAGDAQVAPKIPGITCQYCELHSLCRVDDE